MSIGINKYTYIQVQVVVLPNPIKKSDNDDGNAHRSYTDTIVHDCTIFRVPYMCVFVDTRRIYTTMLGFKAPCVWYCLCISTLQQFAGVQIPHSTRRKRLEHIVRKER